MTALQEVMNKLGAVHIKSEWRAACPLCQPDEQDPERFKMVINPGHKRLVICRCFVCCFEGNTYNREWWIEICRRIDFPSEVFENIDVNTIKSQWSQLGVVINRAGTAANIEILNYVYSKMLSYIGLLTEHKEWLAERGLDPGWAYTNGYRSSPECSDNIAYLLGQQFPTLIETVPGFANSKLLLRKDAIIFPCRNEKNQIFSIKQRLLDGKKARIRLLSSSKYGGPKAVNGCHCPSGVGDSVWDVVWITEGERKADVWWTKTGQPAIAIPGVTAYNTVVPVVTKVLSKGGTAVLALDQDEAGQKAVPLVTGLMQRLGYKVEIASWSDAKGLDDALINNKPITRTEAESVPDKAYFQHILTKTTKADNGFIKNDKLLEWLKVKGPVLRRTIKCNQPYLSQLIKNKQVLMSHTKKGQVVEVL